MQNELNNMILQIMRFTHNFFIASQESGAFSLDNGRIILKNNYIIGQKIILSGSVLSDGIYEIAAKDGDIYTIDDGGKTEEWSGIIYGLRMPRDFIRLCEDISAFNAGQGKVTPYTSEMVVGLHQWSRSTKANGAPVGWEEVFSERLKPFKKMFADISI